MEKDDCDDDKEKKKKIAPKKRGRLALKDLTTKILDAWLNDEVDIIFVNDEDDDKDDARHHEKHDNNEGPLSESEKCRIFTRADLEDFFRPKHRKK